MTILQIIGLVCYSIMFIVSVPLIARYLKYCRSDKVDDSWAFAIILSIFVSFVWPMSLAMIAMNTNANDFNEEESDD